MVLNLVIMGRAQIWREGKMSHKEDWLTKKFDFNIPVSRYLGFLNILRATPQRLEALVDGVQKEILTYRDGDSWSIQENVGHFLSVESLFLGRLDDYNSNAIVLRPARFDNNPTDKANYNEKEIDWILDTFREQRDEYLSQLDPPQPQDFSKTALHPRLNKPMRLCDMLQFHSAHDHHHLVRIEEIIAEII